jgi:dihydroorotase
MSKFLALGMSLTEVVRCATIRPARAARLGDRIGTLRLGGAADLAVFDLQLGDFEYLDVRGERLHGPLRLVNTMTFRAGVEMNRGGDYGPLPLAVRPRDY